MRFNYLILVLVFLFSVSIVSSFDITEDFGVIYQSFNRTQMPYFPGINTTFLKPSSLYISDIKIGDFNIYSTNTTTVNCVFYGGIYSSLTPKYHSQYGLNLSLGQCAAGETTPHRLATKILNESISLSQNTNISFYCGMSSVYSGNPPTYSYWHFLSFNDDNGKPVITFALDNHQTANPECALASLNQTKCCESTIFSCEDSSNMVYNNKKISDIAASCGAANLSLSNIRQVQFEVHSGTYQSPVHSFYVDDFTLTNVYNGSNMLPSVNFSLQDQVICSNNTYPISVNTTVSSFDAEGDTVYYSLVKDSSYLVKDYVTFDDYTYSVSASELWVLEHFVMCDLIGRVGTEGTPNPLFCGPFENTGVSLDKSDTKVTTNCNISDSVSDPDEQDKTLFWEWDRYQDYMLGVNVSKGCGSYHYQVQVHSDVPSYNDSLQGLSFLVRMENNSALQIDGNKNNYNPIFLNRTLGQTDVYVLGSKVLSTHQQQIAMKILFNYNTGTYTLSFANVTNGVYTEEYGETAYNISGSLPPHHLYVAGTSGIFYLDNIFFYRENNNITFTGTSPESVSFTKPGKYDVNLYVTDSPHYGTDYEIFTQSVQIQDGCEGSFTNINKPSLFNPLLEIKDVLGVAWSNYLTGIGGLDTAKLALWVLFVVCLVVLMVVMWFQTQTLELTMPLFVTSLLFTFLAFLLSFTAHLIVFLICLAFSLALPFAKSFTGGTNGG